MKKKLLVMVLGMTIVVATGCGAKKDAKETIVGNTLETTMDTVANTETDVTSDMDETEDDLEVVVSEDEIDAYDPEEFSYPFDLDENKVNLSIYLPSDEQITVETLTIEYYVEEKLVDTVEIVSMEKDQDYNISVSRELLGEAEYFEVKYIVNDDENLSWTRGYENQNEDFVQNVIDYSEEYGIGSAVCG